MKWKSWGSSYHSGPAGVFSEHLFCKWGQNIFPLSFFGGGIILKPWLAKRAYTCARLHWPTTIKIDSNGIWWLTQCLNLEKKRGEKTTWGKAQGLTHTQQLHARVSSNASAIRKTTWVKMEKKVPWNTFTLSGYYLNTHDWGKQTLLHACFLS